MTKQEWLRFKAGLLHVWVKGKMDPRTIQEIEGIPWDQLSDIRSESGELMGAIRSLPWETSLLSKPCYQVFHAGRIHWEQFVKAFRYSARPGIYWLRLGTGKKRVILDGNRCQPFEPIVEMVNLQRTLDVTTNFDTHPDASVISRQDADRFARQAGGWFVFDRFHADRKIAKKKADALHEDWIRNAILSKVADACMGVRKGGQLIGFHAVKMGGVGDQKVGMTVLIGVHPKFAGLGHGRRLLASGLDWMRNHGATQAWVRTERSNTDACRLYISSGFRESLTFQYYRSEIR